jgi:hypothetical protein
MATFSSKIEDIIGKFDPSFILEEDTAAFETLYSRDDTEDESNLPPLNVDDEDGLDPLIDAETILPQGDGISLASLNERRRANDGSPIGRQNKNPLLDSRIYIVNFPDGQMKDVGYNILVDHLSSQVDKDSNHFKLFSSIVGHRRNGNAVDKDDQMKITDNRQVKNKTLAGWALEVE